MEYHGATINNIFDHTHVSSEMMKNIFYCSHMQMGLFPNNTRSRFESFININDLDYLPDHNIEAAIKSITFHNQRYEPQLLEEIRL